MKAFLDFDGVICDSAFEAFRIGLVVSGGVSDPMDNKLDDLYLDFLKKRADVGPAWNYLYVFQELLNDEWSHWDKTNTALDFQKKFFEVRAKFKTSSELDWLKLHKFYDDVVVAMNDSDIELNILTNKNKDPVKRLVDLVGLNIRNIYSMPEMENISSKADFLSGVSGELKFIDDHPGIVREVISATNISVDSKQASWGYCNEIVAGHAISIDKFGEWLNG